MFRLLGFLLGSALSIGALILLLGLPKLAALSKPEVLEQLEPISQQAAEIMEEVVDLAKVPGNLDTANDFEDVEPAKVPGTLNEVPGTVVMVDDPEEFHNLYDDPAHRQIRDELTRRAEAWRAEGEPLFPENNFLAADFKMRLFGEWSKDTS